MRFNALRNRLLALEGKGNAQDVVLVFADGSTRAVRCKDPLGTVIGAWDRQWAQCVCQPQPASPSDAVLDLMAHAVGVADGSDPFLSLAQQCARDAIEVNPQTEVNNE